MRAEGAETGRATEAGFRIFVITPPGIEPITLAELAGLGVRGEVHRGGIAFNGDAMLTQRANLELRSASRVVVRLGVFRARALGELARRSATLPWERFVRAGEAIDLRVTSKKSRLYHTEAIAERVAEGASARLGGQVEHQTSGSDDDAGAARRLVIVRAAQDEFTVSIDSSGALLHMRGYRQAVARAPIRENLAAAVLLAAGYDGTAPLLDPMCGSGTIAIEGALIARDIAPGSGRGFAFEQWPAFDRAAWASMRDAIRARSRAAAPAPIVGSDRDAGAIEASASNAGRAGVAADLELRIAALSAVRPPSDTPGWLVTNPPYGVRIGEERALRDLYARLGQLVRERFQGWNVAIVSGSDRLAQATGLEWRELFRTRTGGLPVRALVHAAGAGQLRGAKRGRPSRRSM